MTEYLMSRTLCSRGFLELVLAEQFFARLRKPNGVITRVNTLLARAFVETGVAIDSTAVKKCGGISILLLQLVLSARTFGFDEHGLFILKHLLQKGAVLSSEVLQYSTQSGTTEVFEVLEQHGAHFDENGDLALLQATKKQQFTAVRWLLGRGADIKAKFRGRGHPSRFLTLIWAALTLYINDVDKFTPPFEPPCFEVNSPTLELVQFLLDNGADMKKYVCNQSPFDLCAEESVISDYAELMANNPAEMAKLSDREWEKLLLSSSCDDDDCRRLFDILRSQHVFDPAMLLTVVIATGGSPDSITELLSSVSDLDRYAGWFKTPLQAAALRCDKKLVLQLLEKGADINAPPPKHMRTALAAIIFHRPNSAEGSLNRSQLARTLIDRGANCHWISTAGRTMLHLCAEVGEVEIAKLLLEKRVGPNIVDKTTFPFVQEEPNRGGSTALDLAAWFGRLDLTHLLLKSGGLSGHTGRTGYDGAIHLGQTAQHLAVVEIIRKHKADMDSQFSQSYDLFKAHQTLVREQVNRQESERRQSQTTPYIDGDAWCDESLMTDEHQAKSFDAGDDLALLDDRGDDEWIRELVSATQNASSSLDQPTVEGDINYAESPQGNVLPERIHFYPPNPGSSSFDRTENGLLEPTPRADGDVLSAIHDNDPDSRMVMCREPALARAISQLESIGEWLSDDTIELVQDAIWWSTPRSSTKDKHLLDPLYLQLDISQIMPDLPQRAAAANFLILPLHHQKPVHHWTLAIIDTCRRQVLWYDPLPDP